MPTMEAIAKRLKDLAEQQDQFIQTVIAQIEKQQFHAFLDAEFVNESREQFCKTKIELALACLPIAACYASVPISDFRVGTIVIGTSGNFYFGANQEFNNEAISQTIHAEQSAISHAWQMEEKAISDVIVHYTPCGHCRQFMNELNTAKSLKIHLPHRQNNLLHSYLPDAFGPKDLNIEKVFFDLQDQAFIAEGDELVQNAIHAANTAYAPYTGSFSGVALQLTSGRILIGRCAENAAFNPSLPPLQVAINYQRMAGLMDEKVVRVVMAEKVNTISHKTVTKAMVSSLFSLDLEYVLL